MRLPFARARDPFWDLDGDGVRRVRRKRVAFSVGILAVAVVLLLFVWGVPGVRAASTGVNLDQSAGVPGVTVPPTTALSDDVAPPPSQGQLPVVLLGLFVTTFATLLGVRRAGRTGRSRGGRRRIS